MPTLEIDFSEEAGKWGVWEGNVPLTSEDTKQAAKRFAKQQSQPGDTVIEFTRDHRVSEEWLVDEGGEWVAAGRGGQSGSSHGGGGGLFGTGGGGGNGSGGMFGGGGNGGWF